MFTCLHGCLVNWLILFLFFSFFFFFFSLPFFSFFFFFFFFFFYSKVIGFGFQQFFNSFWNTINFLTIFIPGNQLFSRKIFCKPIIFPVSSFFWYFFCFELRKPKNKKIKIKKGQVYLKVSNWGFIEEGKNKKGSSFRK